MNNLAIYEGGGGREGTNFARDSRTIYQTMRADPQNQRLEGFGPWEFVKLLGTRLTGEAREVHNAYVDEWAPGDRTNPNFRRARSAERKRALWKIYRRDRCTWISLRGQAGFEREPEEPDFPEPDDLEHFLFDLQDRFRSSTTQNLKSIHDFKTKKNEGIEQMFARFNLIARPLENESPPAITKNQITTHYVHHLAAILKPEDMRDLERLMQDSERRRTEEGRRPLDRHHIHAMALRQDREIVIRQTRLRAAGIVSAPQPSIQDRLTNKLANRLGEQPTDKNTELPRPKGRHDERERRTCNNCLIRGHLQKDCTNPTAEKVKEEMRNLKRPSLENGGATERVVLARTAATDGGRGRGAGRGGGRAGGRGAGRGINPRNPHMTENATCAYCHTPNHTEAQCWRKNPHLRPGANLAALSRAGELNDREWEAEHLARERRQKALEDARDEREALKDEGERMDHADARGNGQYMYIAREELTIAADRNQPQNQGPKILLEPIDDDVSQYIIASVSWCTTRLDEDTW